METATRPASKAWDAEFNELVLPLLDENQAAFLMYRKDEQNAHGFVWIMICWVPDWAPVREKMLYASTRATLRKEFGDYRVGDEVFGTSQVKTFSVVLLFWIRVYVDMFFFVSICFCW